MLFNSQAFLLVFLPLTLLAYTLAGNRTVAREWVLTIASLGFYGYWDIRFLPLLAGSIVCNWGLGQIHARRPGLPLVPLGVALNLGLLAYFKYWNFFGEGLATLLGHAYQASDIVLPIGISFFTFQQLSYLQDLRHGRAPAYNLRRYTFYVSFFPQLIAGPIVRHSELIPQLDDVNRRDPWTDRARGAVFFCIGLAKKFLIADKISPYVDRMFQLGAQGPIAPQDAWTGALGFTLQIYFDFSAYSDMAIGLALLFGLTMPYNFDAPYKADTLQEFWRRWHMTLSRFFRDYLYIPLGGNRRGLAIQLGALLLTMGLCGLWHGAGWNFVLWGAMHGLGLVVVVLWRKTGVAIPRPVSWLATLAFVVFAWVLFRASSLATVQEFWTAMLGLGESVAPTNGAPVRMLIAGGLIVLLAPTSQELVTRWFRPWRVMGAVMGVALVALILELGKGRPAEFIYFAF